MDPTPKNRKENIPYVFIFFLSGIALNTYLFISVSNCSVYCDHMSVLIVL